MSDVFPLPGTPCRRYPRRNGIPRSAYLRPTISHQHGTVGSERRNTPVLGRHEVLAVREEHLLHARLEHDRAHGALLPRAVIAPAPVCAVGGGVSASVHIFTAHDGEEEGRRNATHGSARKMCTRCSASFSYMRFASSTSFFRMSLLRATTLAGRTVARQRSRSCSKTHGDAHLIFSSAQCP